MSFDGFGLLEVLLSLLLLSFGMLAFISGLLGTGEYAVEGFSFTQEQLEVENDYERSL